MSRESPMHQAIRERIEREYARNPEYTFTTEDFIDLAPTKNDRQKISTTFCKLASLEYRTRKPTIKVVGKTQIPGKQGTANIYGVVSLPLTNRRYGMPKHPSKPRKMEQYQREYEPTPAPVLEVHNILFNLGVRK